MMDIAAIQTLLQPLLPGLLGIRLTSIAPDRVCAEMEVRPELCTSGGILHGGATMAFAELTSNASAYGKISASTPRFPSGSRVSALLRGTTPSLRGKRPVWSGCRPLTPSSSRRPRATV